MHRILVINPGSTSTKIGVFLDGEAEHSLVIKHNETGGQPSLTKAEVLKNRQKLIVEELKRSHWIQDSFHGIIARGGLLKPIPSGVYSINQKMLDELQGELFGEHASNIGALIAWELSEFMGVSDIFIMDPIVVDEMDDVARVSGLNGITRKSVFHALNQKAVAKRYYQDVKKSYNQSRLIVAHLGGGVSVGTHLNGRVVDVNNAVNGDGPFSAERSGSLPMVDVVDLCFSGRYGKQDVLRLIVGEGGMKSYFQTQDVQWIEEQMQLGDEKAKGMMEAFVYQIAKEIGAHGAVLSGDVDAIVITGGIAHSHYVTEQIAKRVGFLGPVVVYPGEGEMQTLADGAWSVLTGEVNCKMYE